jgi:PAS domain S-box-containing protein
VLEVSRDFIYKLNVETGTYDYVSPSVLRLTGFTPEEFIAMKLKGVAERAHPEDEILLNMPFRMLLDLSSEDSSVARVEYRWKHKDGEYLWVSDSRSLIRDENGRAIALVGTVRDETKRKQAEAALRESEEQFRNVLEVSRDLIYKLNLQTHTYDYVSPSVLRLVGFAPQEIVAMGLEGVIERFHPEDRERLGTHPSRLPDDTVEGREAPTIEYRWQCKDGEYRWLSDNRAFVLDEAGRALALVGTVRDITEAMAAEAALRKSEEKHRILFETIAQGIVYQSADGAIISANPAAERILGLTIDQMQGRTSIDPRWKATHEDGSDFPGETHPSMVALKTGRKVLNVVMGVFNPKDDSHRWININAIPVFRPGENKPYQVYTTFEDITERKQADAAMATRLRMESAIARASNLLVGPEDVDAALNLALRILGEAFGADRAHIFLLRDNNTRMDNTSEWCAPGVEPQIDNLQDLDCAAFPCWIDRLSQNEPIIMTDTSAAPPDAVTEKKRWKALNIRSLLAVPLLSDGKPIGYVRFANMKSDSTEREENIRLLRLASESIASFIERQRAGEDKRRAYESIVLLLATAAEARDPYTEDHLYRIRGFAEAIAAELGLPPDEIREIGLSSLLHDLGKMRVPDSILTKPGPLSDEEWVIMRRHTTWGEELLSAHPWLETARQIARWHHERWDGTGYPDGLRAAQIPLGAAIVAVADGLDAMISDRPYRKAWPSRQAIEEIRMQKGRQYSPDVVEAFNRALRKGEIKRVVSATLRLSELDRAA